MAITRRRGARSSTASFLKDDALAEMKKKHVYLVATLFAGAWVGEHLDTMPPPIAVKARAAAMGGMCPGARTQA